MDEISVAEKGAREAGAKAALTWNDFVIGKDAGDKNEERFWFYPHAL